MLRRQSGNKWLIRITVLFVAQMILTSNLVQTASALGTGPVFTSVSAGERFTCGLTSTGDVFCWGENDNNQLGTSALNANSTPNQVFRVSNAVQVASGRDFACARISDGGVACWGRADLGQTGDGVLTSTDRFFATRVHGINSAIDISAGEGHACAVSKDFSVACWGQNQYGQVGNERNKFERMPVKVEGIPNIIQVSAGQGHTCALGENKFVYCWGDNKFGQLGIGLTQSLKRAPSVVLGIQNVKSIQIGYNTSCAFQDLTGIWCWGWGRDGQSGQIMDRAIRWLPEVISTVLLTAVASNPSTGSLIVPSIDFEKISIGPSKVCGIATALKNNVLYCWGLTRTTDPGTSTSTTFTSGTSVSIGDGHGCIVTTVGTVSCWGWNHKGQLGLGVQSNSFSTLSMVGGFPDWLYWITDWKISYENNLGILKWTGGSGSYVITIQGLGIVCEGRTALSCTFGPLDSNTKYVGTITSINTPVANNRTMNVEFTTSSLTSALDQYLLDLTSAAKAKADLAKAEAFLASLSNQIELASKVESSAEVNFTKELGVANKYFETLDAADANVARATKEIKKMIWAIQSVVVKIMKKIGT
jgi:alpha-tubulin suppressor-like RCC1 family protein